MKNKNKYIFILFIALIVGCNRKIAGVYNSISGWHRGEGIILEIIPNGKAKIRYQHVDSSITVRWKRSSDTLFFYSYLYYHPDPIFGDYNSKGFDKLYIYYLIKGADSISAVDSVDQYLSKIKPNYQLTNNDSVDIFLIKKDTLYILTREGEIGNEFVRRK